MKNAIKLILQIFIIFFSLFRFKFHVSKIFLKFLYCYTGINYLTILKFENILETKLIFTKSDIAIALYMSLRTFERRIKEAEIKLKGNRFSKECVERIIKELNDFLITKVIIKSRPKPNDFI